MSGRFTTAFQSVVVAQPDAAAGTASAFFRTESQQTVRTASDKAAARLRPIKPQPTRATRK
jgi:hypothetical protein